MARNDIHIDAPPARVFAVLADPYAYGDWVVGSKHIRGHEGGWPAVGAKFHHRVGAGWLTVADHTRVMAMEPDRRIVLEARAQPLGRAHVTVELAPEGSGTRVTMIEDGADWKGRLGHQPLGQFVLRRRNDVSLNRLRRLSERPADG